MNHARQVQIGWMLAIVLWALPVSGTEFTMTGEVTERGYLVYCPCMGRLGNQVSHLLGAMETARASGRTLVLPPFIDYRAGKPYYIPFEQIYSVAAVNEYVPAVTLSEFLSMPHAWPKQERRLYCSRRFDNVGCPSLQGSPQKNFWADHNINFVDSVAVEGLSPATNAGLGADLSAVDHPVVALRGTPGAFPTQQRNWPLQRFLVWSDDVRIDGERFLDGNIERPLLALHLRNGSDWQRACGETGVGLSEFFASAQCGLSMTPGAVNPDSLAGSQPGSMQPPTEKPLDDKITAGICLPGPDEVIRAITMAQKRFGPFRTLFIGTDHNDHHEAIQQAVGDGVRLVLGASPTRDLYVFAQADLLVANCASSFSAIAVRDRKVHGRPTVFFGFPEWTPGNSQLAPLAEDTRESNSN